MLTYQRRDGVHLYGFCVFKAEELDSDAIGGVELLGVGENDEGLHWVANGRHVVQLEIWG